MTGSPNTRRSGPPTLPGARAAGVLADTRAELEATREILRVIARSRGDTQPVFDTIARLALALCHAHSANVFTYDGALVHIAAMAIVDPAGIDALRKFFPRPASRDTGATRAVLTRSVALIPDVTADPDYRLWDEGLRAGFRSVLAVPLLRERHPIGAIAVGRPAPGPFSHHEVALLESFAEQATIAIENARLIREIEARNATIRALVEDTRANEVMLGRSPLLVQMREEIAQVAATDSTVLIGGETGTGKELVARAIHAASRAPATARSSVSTARRCRATSSRASCSATRRARSPARSQQRRGRFELADGGTPLPRRSRRTARSMLQAKLLRVLQEREFERVGGTRVLRVDVRVIAATNRDLPAEVEAGRFRADLFYRLDVFPLVPAAAARAARGRPVARWSTSRGSPRAGSAGRPKGSSPDSLRERRRTPGQAMSASSRTSSSARSSSRAAVRSMPAARSAGARPRFAKHLSRGPRPSRRAMRLSRTQRSRRWSA